jgi:hypothetical protein
LWGACALVVPVALPKIASAKTEISITSFKTPELGKPGARESIEKTFRRALYKASKGYKFGSFKRLGVTMRLTEYSVQHSDGLVRISCTLIGRLDGGGTAKSHISFGGQPTKQKALEKQVVRMVSDGVMGRLADMSRTKDAIIKKKAKEDAEQGTETAPGQDGGKKGDKPKPPPTRKRWSS